jgi:phage replication-related protein YjqB (UPF0714/DUF867 family)
MSETAVRIRDAQESQTTLREGLHPQEHAAVFSERPRNLLQSGEQYQVRLRRAAGSGFSLYTVSETHAVSGAADVVFLGPDARARLGLSSAAVLEMRVPHPGLSDGAAQQANEFVERVTGSGTHLIAIAPHGGEIEPRTDAQAALVAERFGSDGRGWVCKGFGAGGGAAFRRWHITSAEISERSFPKLRALLRTGFTHAVAFHGWDLAHIGVGGRAAPSLKKAVRQAIEEAVRGQIEVVLETSSSFSGTSKRNIVNRLAASGKGLHIEQSLPAREDHWEAIAAAVAAVFEAISSPLPAEVAVLR